MIRRIAVIVGVVWFPTVTALILSSAKASPTRALPIALITTAVLYCWIMTLVYGVCYLWRRWRAEPSLHWPFIVSVVLLIGAYLASATAFPVIAEPMGYVGLKRPAPAQFFIDLSDFMKAWWWLLLPMGVLLLTIRFSSVERRYGVLVAGRRLRWRLRMQWAYLTVLALGTLLARWSIGL
jgi:hypothetical protein